MKYFAAIILTIFPLTAIAQQQPPDPILLQRALASIQSQRNQAFDALALAEAKLAIASDDLAKAQTRIKELDKSAELK